MMQPDDVRRYVKGVAQNTLPLMMTCEEFEVFLQDFIAGDGLTPFQRFKFRLHLLFCRECQDYFAAYKRAMAATSAAYADEEAIASPPADLVEAVMRARGSA